MQGSSQRTDLVLARPEAFKRKTPDFSQSKGGMPVSARVAEISFGRDSKASFKKPRRLRPIQKIMLFSKTQQTQYKTEFQTAHNTAWQDEPTCPLDVGCSNPYIFAQVI